MQAVISPHIKYTNMASLQSTGEEKMFVDISQAMERIQLTQTVSSLTDTACCNPDKWQKPITEFGQCDPELLGTILRSDFVGDIDCGSADWTDSCQVVDAVMDLILKQLQELAGKYEGLCIKEYIRQGSAREGLKVINANEFDMLLEFHIEGLDDVIDYASITNSAGRSIPGSCNLKMNGVRFEKLQKMFPTLTREGVFVRYRNGLYLSSKILHERIFESMVDTAINQISLTMGKLSSFSRRLQLKRKINPPSINVNIKVVCDGQPTKEIDVDLVPAYRLREDKTTRYEERFLNCPIHAVCKWVTQVESAERIVWDLKTLGYEKHILDVARENRRKLFILTALRIVKTYFVRRSKYAKISGVAPPQLVTVLKSYQLKQIAFYALYYLCHRFPDIPLKGATEALAYYLELLDITLVSKRLPHFFYGCSIVNKMLPGFPQNFGFQLRYNLFQTIDDESLSRARQSLCDDLIPDLGFKFGVVLNVSRSRVRDSFLSFVQSQTV
ncbi:uncharacterized protein LOC127844338 isoform X1 [Dreissena polymorpha]|uniref:uncharacterized protein LOC127844338 isoform X1 n=1 Tax=Dreissena polymorpha TaxID=45954 RepID=UPI00226547B5|nr:uncharacterized protein LOC127844338 isoform X1 [Dreissena polymorpha]